MTSNTRALSRDRQSAEYIHTQLKATDKAGNAEYLSVGWWTRSKSTRRVGAKLANCLLVGVERKAAVRQNTHDTVQHKR